MARGDAQHDLETARSVRPGRQWPDHDQPPNYAPMQHPAGERLSMDPHRYAADGWGHAEGLAMPKVHDSGLERGRFRFWAICPRCPKRIEGWSEASVVRKMREHMAT